MSNDLQKPGYPSALMMFLDEAGEAKYVSPENPIPGGGGGGGGGSTADRELVVTTYVVKTAFTGASVGDTITCTQVLDVTATPSTVAVVWRNQTTGSDLATAPSAANLTLVGAGGATEATQANILAGMATSALQTANNEFVQGVANGVGAPADAQATNGTGSWSLVAMAKGLFTVLSAMSAKLPASLGAKTGATSLSIVPATDAGLATQTTLAALLAGQTSGTQQSKFVDAGGVTQARVIPISGDGVALSTNALMTGAMGLVFNPDTSNFYMARGDTSGSFVAASRFWVESTTPLPANGTVNGGSKATGAVAAGIGSRFKRFRAQAISDQTGTLLIKGSYDGTNWYTLASIATSAVAGGYFAELSISAMATYYSAVFTNGSTAQTRLALVSALEN